MVRVVEHLIPKWNDDLERLAAIEVILTKLSDDELRVLGLVVPGPNLTHYNDWETWQVQPEQRGQLRRIYLQKLSDRLDKLLHDPDSRR